MKKIFLLMTVCLIALSGCSKDEDTKFNYDIKTLYGTWQITHVDTKGGSDFSPWILATTTATFNSDGTYSGSGYFGNGTGTYKAKGKTVTCYVEGKEYIKYDIISLESTLCTLKMYDETAAVTIKCKKI